MRPRPRRGAAVACAVAALLCAAAPASAQMEPSQVTEATLKNGMRVLVWPDHDIPNVAMYVWFRVGSRNEAPGITGVSHFFEHMMFNGARKYGPGEFDRVMEAAGGANNAFTSPDVTVYQDWFPRDALELMFEMEADRIGSLKIEPKMVESERGVVYSERRTSVDNNIYSLLDESVRAVAFVAHPYGIPVIGWPSDIEGWSIEDLRAHFRRYYAPNNAVLIVVGDVTPDRVLALARKTLGKIPPQPEPAPVKTVEPRQLGERRLTVHRPSQVSLVELAWHAPAAVDPMYPAIELLESILLGGESSRLYRRLVDEEQVASDVSGGVDDGFDPGLFSIVATVSTGADPARVEALIKEELQKVASGGVSEEEVKKARNLELAGFYHSIKTINGRGRALGHYDVLRGGWRALFDAPTRYESVAAEDVKAAAAKLFAEGYPTVGVLVPAAGGGDDEEP